MNEPVDQRPADELPAKPSVIPYALLDVLLGWLIAGIVFSLAFATEWTDHWHGFFAGLIHWFVLLAIPYAVVAAPILGFVSWYLRRRQKRRFALVTAGVPAMAMLCLLLVGWILDPPVQQRRLENALRAKVPAGIKFEKWFLEGGGISDRDEMYLLSGTASALDDLRSVGGFKRTTAPPDSNIYSAFKGREGGGFPDATRWEDAVFFEKDKTDNPVFLVINKERTRAMIVTYSF
jgi:hypothetical protein